MGDTNEVNLSDCFDYYQKVELMDGENQMYCNYCNSNSPSYYSTTLYSSPQIFILILNRGRGNIYNVKLNFSEIINKEGIEQKKKNFIEKLIKDILFFRHVLIIYKQQ